jgi:hypothetical protein
MGSSASALIEFYVGRPGLYEVLIIHSELVDSKSTQLLLIHSLDSTWRSVFNTPLALLIHPHLTPLARISTSAEAATPPHRACHWITKGRRILSKGMDPRVPPWALWHWLQGLLMAKRAAKLPCTVSFLVRLGPSLVSCQAQLWAGLELPLLCSPGKLEV